MRYSAAVFTAQRSFTYLAADQLMRIMYLLEEQKFMSLTYLSDSILLTHHLDACLPGADQLVRIIQPLVKLRHLGLDGLSVRAFYFATFDSSTN